MKFKSKNIEFYPDKNFIIINNKIIKLNIREYKEHPKVYFKITNKCNLNCIYCFQKEDQKNMNTPELNKYKKIIRAIIEEDPDVVIFGGEPLLSQNINNINFIFENIFKKHTVSFFSNGNFNKDIIDVLLKNKGKISNIIISIDGCEEVHNSRRIRYKGNSFNTIINNCKVLLGNNIPFDIQVNIDKDNMHDLKPLINYLHNELGIKYYSIIFNRVLRTEKSITELELLTVYLSLCKEIELSNVIINSNILKKLTTYLTGEGRIKSRCPILKQKVYDFTSNKIYCCPQSVDTIVGEFNFDNQNIYCSELNNYNKISCKNNKECLECEVSDFCSYGCIIDEKDVKCKQIVYQNIDLIINNFKYFFDVI
jgi:uncharacterized protein